MILVVMGTETWPFNRLVQEVDRLAGAGQFGDDEVFVQLGACTYQPTNCRWQTRVSFGEMSQRVRAARLVIAHAGAGTFMLCRHAGTPQIMVPRRAARGENVDDHQVQFAERLAALGLVRTVMEVDELGRAVAETIYSATRHVGEAGPSSLVASLRALAKEWNL